MEKIERAFRRTCELLLDGPLPGGIDEYGQWLTKHVKGKVIWRKSAISARDVFLPDVDFYRRLEPNIVTLDESLELGKNAISLKEVESISLSNARGKLGKIKTTTPEIIYGENIGSEECSNYGPTQYCYRSTFCWFSKYIAYSFWPRESEHLFGCSNVAANCNFSIHCYSSTKLSRCFEVNDSNSCTDCYFCHNCENLVECMFCFNTKGKRYAIGNKEVGREAYMRIKKLVQEQIRSELSESKSLKYDIYSLAIFGTNAFKIKQA
jgi:hypothetical protein